MFTEVYHVTLTKNQNKEIQENLYRKLSKRCVYSSWRECNDEIILCVVGLFNIRRTSEDLKTFKSFGLLSYKEEI